MLTNNLSIDDAIDVMAQLPQQELPLQHFFSPGIYVRHMIIPAQTMVVGKRHRKTTLNIFISGDMSLILSDGTLGERVQGPMIFNSEPNVRKVLYTHTDCVFLNIHPNEDDEKDFEILEKKYIITDEEYNELIANNCKKAVNTCHGEW